MTDRERLPDMYVLDSLANDIEDLDNILRILNSDTTLGWHKQWGRHFGREEIVQSLARLIKNGCVRVSVLTADGKWLEELAPLELPPESFDHVWFAMTPHGRIVHTNWHPAGLDDEPSS
jgi:hypothetical protein